MSASGARLGEVELLQALLELDSDLGIAEPDDFADPGRLILHQEVESWGDSVCGLNLKARASVGKITNRAWNLMAAENDLPGSEHARSLN